MRIQPGRPRPRRPRGFSLLEMLAVVTIMGVLAVIIVPRIGGHTYRAKRSSCQQYKADLNAALERFQFDNNRLPATLDELHPGHYPEAIPVCPVTGSAYSIDVAKGRIAGHDHPP